MIWLADYVSLPHISALTRNIRRSVFTEATIDCKALAALIEAFCAVPVRSLAAHGGLIDTQRNHERGGRPMPPDHDHFTGSVDLDDAGSVMREIVR